jgi:8-oxo-dGTP pyrophosphatase MutT (NUDIX family)
VVRAQEGELQILLIRDPYRKWGLPKGHLEGDEDEAEAALREVHEETGLEHLILGPDLGEIDWTFRLRGRRIHKFCRFFLMSSPHGSTAPQVAEGITECRWLAPPDAVARVGYENARGILRRALERLVLPDDPKNPPWRASDRDHSGSRDPRSPIREAHPRSGEGKG